MHDKNKTNNKPNSLGYSAFLTVQFDWIFTFADICIFDEFQDYNENLQGDILKRTDRTEKAWILFDPNQVHASFISLLFNKHNSRNDFFFKKKYMEKCVHTRDEPTFGDWETHKLEYCMRNTQEIAKSHSSNRVTYKIDPTLPRGFPLVKKQSPEAIVNYIKSSQQKVRWQVLLGYHSDIQNVRRLKHRKNNHPILIIQIVQRGFQTESERMVPEAESDARCLLCERIRRSRGRCHYLLQAGRF